MTGILERIEAKLDELLARGVDVTSASATALTGTAPQVEAVAGVQTGQTELDGQGFPWDERIHAGSKEKVQAGTWKYKRGVDQHDKDQVENEFRAAGYGTASGSVSGVPAGDMASTQPETTPPVVQAATPAPAADAGTGIPGLNLPVTTAPAVPPTPPKVEMPDYVAGQEIDDSLLSQIATAFYAQAGEEQFNKLVGLFRLPEGSPVTAIAQQDYRDSFHRIAVSPELQAHYLK